MEKTLHSSVGGASRNWANGETPSSLVELLLQRCDTSFDHLAIIDPLAGKKLDWGQLLQQSVAVAEQLEAAGMTAGDRVLHIGPHSAAWPIVDFGCLLSGVVHVALHAEESQSDQGRHLQLFKPSGLILSGGMRYRSFIQHGLPLLEVQVNWSTDRKDRAALRHSIAERVQRCDPDRPAAVLISSGTTGRPKGFVHSQRSLVMNATASAVEFLEEPDDVRLSWLPQSHALARVGDLYTTVVRGGALNVVRDRRQILEACKKAPPAAILGVPIFYDRLARAVQQGKITNLCDALGGRVRVCVSGGAPLRQWTARVFQQHDVPLVEGYGLAEAGPVVAVSNPRCRQAGTVGRSLRGIEIKISDKEFELGQIFVRTPCRALSVIDPARGGDEFPIDNTAWLETGDTGVIDEDGQLRITGRMNDILTLSNGIKFSPTDIETALLEEPAVAQVCVAGEGLPWPVAFIVPEPRTVKEVLKRFRCQVWSRSQALSHPKVLRWFSRRIGIQQKDLPKRLRVKRFVLVDHPFDVAHGEATESFKIKRHVITNNFSRYMEFFEVQAGCTEEMVLPRVGIIKDMKKNDSGKNDSGNDSGSAHQSGRTDSRLNSALWQGSSAVGHGGGFSFAAKRMVAGLSSEVSGVVDNAIVAIQKLRDSDELYDKTEGIPMPAAPLADPPAPPTGKLSKVAEKVLSKTGLWGLFVPQVYGGSGCSFIELVQSITRLASVNPTVSGLLSVHSTIGAVSAVTTFGSEDQQQQWSPQLAEGHPLSVFAATEPDAGCDLHRISSRLEHDGNQLLLTGTKMFITGATYGRLVKLLALFEEKPVIVLVQLPQSNTPHFTLQSYGLHPLKHAHNNALDFQQFTIDSSCVLSPGKGPDGQERDGMSIVWHGLNRGRVTLAAQASGTISLLLEQAVLYSGKRCTWGQPIQTRELVLGRLGRMAAAQLVCEALSGWSASLIDDGRSGELEAILAKVVASRCLRQAAVDALGIHGGRAFLVGHPLGDSFHDHFAAGVYEGESDLLGLALFKGIAKHHPLASKRRFLDWIQWRISRSLQFFPPKEDDALLDSELRTLAVQARRSLVAASIETDRLLRTHGRKLAEQQLILADLSDRIQGFISCLAVIHYADRRADIYSVHAAACWCRSILLTCAGKALVEGDCRRLADLGRSCLHRYSA